MGGHLQGEFSTEVCAPLCSLSWETRRGSPSAGLCLVSMATLSSGESTCRMSPGCRLHSYEGQELHETNNSVRGRCALSVLALGLVIAVLAPDDRSESSAMHVIFGGTPLCLRFHDSQCPRPKTILGQSSSVILTGSKCFVRVGLSSRSVGSVTRAPGCR